MQRVSDKYWAFAGGIWHRGLTYEQAAQMEADERNAKIQAQRARGERVIVLTQPTPKARRGQDADE